jgi:hypothetical protein
MTVANGQQQLEQQQPEERPYRLSSNGEAGSVSVAAAEIGQPTCHDGHLLLLGKNGERYLTRYQIDHVQQSHGLCRSIVLNECIPCCNCQTHHTICGCLWAFVRSEMLIFVLQVISLFLGAFKECKFVYILIYHINVAYFSTAVWALRQFG